MFSNLLMIIYQGSFRPFITSKENKFELFNEIFITLVTMHDIFFTNMLSKSTQFLVGWSMIGFMVFNTLVNLIHLLLMFRKNIYLIFVKYYRRMRRCCDKDYMRDESAP